MRSLALFLLVAMIGAGCGSGDASAPRQADPAASAEASAHSGALRIAGFAFLPENVTVETGTKVRWANEDDAPHTATADDGSFDTGDLRQGDAGEVTLSKPGKYGYFCEFHKFMRGTITVR